VYFLPAIAATFHQVLRRLLESKRERERSTAAPSWTRSHEKDRRLVDRLSPGHAPRRQCPRHGHQGPQTRGRRDRSRRPRHEFTSWAFTNKTRAAGLKPSFGTIGDCYDNSMMESFWSSMQIELLNRKKWRTRVDLANAMFDYIEIFYNRQRRHSKLGYITPIEHELRFDKTPIPA
jgi:transposase InsO family protein